MWCILNRFSGKMTGFKKWDLLQMQPFFSIKNHKSKILFICLENVFETDVLSIVFQFDMVHWSNFWKQTLKKYRYMDFVHQLPAISNLIIEPFRCLIFYFVNTEMEFQQVEILADLWETLVFTKTKRKETTK